MSIRTMPEVSKLRSPLRLWLLFFALFVAAWVYSGCKQQETVAAPAVRINLSPRPLLALPKKRPVSDASALRRVEA